MIKFRQKEFAKFKASPLRIKRLFRSNVGKLKKIGNEIVLNPGKSVSNAVGFAVENPIAAAGNTASVVGPFIDPRVLGVPVGSGSVALEASAKRIPIYKKTTQRLGKAYRESRVPNVIEPVVNAGYNYAKIISGGL